MFEKCDELILQLGMVQLQVLGKGALAFGLGKGTEHVSDWGEKWILAHY